MESYSCLCGYINSFLLNLFILIFKHDKIDNSLHQIALFSILDLHLSNLFNSVWWDSNCCEFSLIHHEKLCCLSKGVVESNCGHTLLHVTKMENIPFLSILWLYSNKPPSHILSPHFWNKTKLSETKSNVFRMLTYIFPWHPLIFISLSGTQPSIIWLSLDLSFHTFVQSFNTRVSCAVHIIQGAIVLDIFKVGRNELMRASFSFWFIISEVSVLVCNLRHWFLFVLE